MYINVHMEHMPSIKYEGLKDLVDLLHSADYMSTPDDKLGYFEGWHQHWRT